ncbi:ferredoxin reductase [Janibacter hoylei PVAS-1]|uniref:Ferredoxin reductase n=1 Tax=Janibacter hoylei PVAS-1 TaxID=1210046 RepID=A0A444B105_9MICO|nr:ferredoxin reductase [Janibacter hoylei]RWU82034.1 ferredoxin reductase [Janibacter hoylei PVAS-1]
MTATASRPRTGKGTRSLRDTAARIVQGLATPVVPDDYLDLFAPLRSGADLRGRIVAITPETRDAATITIRPGRDWQGHAPGQYIRVGVDVDGVRHWRAYSLTSDTSARDGLISITVKAMPDGLVSQHLVHRATPGTIIQIDQASGDFVLPQSVPAKVLFLTGGSGITPVMGMLRNHDFDGLDVVHAHSAPTADDVIFARELADAPTGVRAIVRHTDDEGMLTPDQLDEVVPDWRERETWICGPTPMLDAFEAHYAAHGHTELLHVERFRPSIVEAGEGGTASLRVGQETTTLALDGGTTILDAAEDAGVLMPSGCRMGICFGCVLPMTDGSVRDLRTGELTTTTPDDPAVKVQTCISAVAGSCTIETTES